ncbi:MAG: hypothetical protein M1830_004600 [Pleopsidium flavum]|nr:MAG: hypothetical protein M1830_004600 [Pleopsidium flavum]
MPDSQRVSRPNATRAHELAKYYRPDTQDGGSGTRSQAPTPHQDPNSVSSSQASSPNTALTAYAQLTALRLNASRAMISVIDHETQYFIAESTKTLNLLDNSKSETEGDGLWLGCASVSAAGRLCEKTIELPVIPNGFQAFVVNDLSQDPRFNQLPFVTGPPFFRYYAGVPLTTNRGINIGSLFIIDEQVRADLTQEQKIFMTVMSRNIMAYLELGREAEERRRGQTMSRGLARFVEGFSRLDDAVIEVIDVSESWRYPGNDGQTKKTGNDSDKIDTREQIPPSAVNSTHLPDASSRDELKDNGSNSPSGIGTAESASSSDGFQASHVQEEKDNGHRATFGRAANLLRESLQLEGDGGVVYFDTSIGFGTPGSIAEMLSNEDDEHDSDGMLPSGASTEISSPQMYNYSSYTPPANGNAKLERTAAILGFSTGTASSWKGDEFMSALSFKPLTEKALGVLMKRYPRGKLWSFDAGTLDSSSEEEPSRYVSVTSKNKGLPGDRRGKRREAEAKLLLTHFPGVRQLLFTSLWDAGSARWSSGAFCFSFSTLIFSTESELSFCKAFGNCVMAEISRLDTIVSDQSKSDFIGSISHELRSPLHGILASAEFLGETDCDAFQTSLVDTVDACGRTLLDTINHVLDFSKINSFEKNWRAAQKLRRGTLGRTYSKGQTSSMQPDGPALLNIYAETDVAAVCEEVVEGVFAGQVYADYSSLDITNVTPEARGRLSSRGLNPNRTLLGGQSASELDTKEHRVAVIMDIQRHDWIFTTQPGAFRRVIMNIFGNALKYTDHGWVRVSLEAYDAGETHSNRTGGSDLRGGIPTKVQITVTDTGRGISPEYLRTKLYTPFAQENTLAPGTGLGLSIVRSIVNMLGGSIDVRSQLGKGTEVKVVLPMMRGVQGSDTPLSTPSSMSTSRQQNDSITILREQARGTRIALYGFSTDSQDDKSTDTKSLDLRIEKSLATYITEWYDIAVTTSGHPTSSADIVIIDEEHLSAFHCGDPTTPGASAGPALVCLCSNATRYRQSSICAAGVGVVEFVSKPFGPYKLAKALRLCLDRFNMAKQGTENMQTIAVPKETAFDSNMEEIIPEFEKVAVGPHDKTMPMNILDHGVVQANETSVNAHMAVNISTADSKEPPEPGVDFPFPDAKGPPLEGDMIRRKPEPTSLSHQKTFPLTPPTDTSHAAVVSRRGEVLSTSDSSEESNASEKLSKQEKQPPRILLVDDNKINLRLLQTYMRKRQFSLVDSADNGQEAVRAAQQCEGYDVIFMDISMPVMNGFEATRAIREIEAHRHTMLGGNAHRPALIIALTGLASGKDQSEAFTSGVDLFMTKPVSFKEVGRMLDNWEVNGGLR